MNKASLKDRFRHKASGALGEVISWSTYSDRPPEVTLTSISPPEDARTYPFEFVAGGASEAPRAAALDLTIQLAELQRDWVPT